MKKILAGAALAAAVSVMGAVPAFAGEVTGKGKPTPISEGRAKSACAFSGLEDGLTLTGFDPETGAPIIIEVDSGPGLTQTPHAEPAAGIVHAPGIPGQACRGNAPSEL